jgi:Protein of unknown function DUF262
VLADEIIAAQRQVKTDAYQMSIGEVVNMYKEGEIIIDPEFQRLFRWDLGQKSKLFESLLLGIPLPSIFVFEREDSKWELIDGLQRMSTILEFMGLLKSPEGLIAPPSWLQATGYLPSLHNSVWEKNVLIDGLSEDDQIELAGDMKLAIRRSRIAVEILKRPSDNNTKYDLFQRLNAGGTPANAQELRNCVIIMANRDFYNQLKALSENEDFKIVTAMSEDQLEKQRSMEYVSRFMVHLKVPFNGKLDVEEFINEGIVNLSADAVTEADERAFTTTFQLLRQGFEDGALRRFIDGTPKGRVSLAIYEIVAIGIAKNIAAILNRVDPLAYVKERVEALWARPDTDQFFSAGMRGTTRIQRTIPFGEQWFADD